MSLRNYLQDFQTAISTHKNVKISRSVFECEGVGEGVGVGLGVCVYVCISECVSVSV